MFQDLRYGVRMLLKTPAFTVVSILSLAIGIGANTAIFSIVKSVLISPLPFAHPDRLLQARYHDESTGTGDDWVSHRDLVDWQERSQSFERIAAYRFAMLNLAEDTHPEAIYGLSVTHDLLPALGVQPAGVLRMVVARGMQPVLIGGVVGLLASMAFSRVLGVSALRRHRH